MIRKKGFYETYIKRFLDIVLSLVALIILSPVLLLISILVKIDVGSSILFEQYRPGLNEKIFKIYKFKTMTDKRDESGKLLPDSLRLTKFGKFLRTTSLDELPELWNIVRGDMSIVGPRPLLVQYLPYYTETEKLRHTVRPGLTGLAQINGRNGLEWNIRLAMDVKYVQHINFISDVIIIIKTIRKVIKKEDVTIFDQISLEELDVERKNLKN